MQQDEAMSSLTDVVNLAADGQQEVASVSSTYGVERTTTCRCGQKDAPGTCREGSRGSSCTTHEAAPPAAQRYRAWTP